MESAAAVQAAAVSSTNFLVVINFGMPVSLCMGRRSGGRISETWRAGWGRRKRAMIIMSIIIIISGAQLRVCMH